MMTDNSKKLFSDETISEVRRTWNLINADLQAVGVDILLRLFEKYPTYQQLFSSFKDTPQNELKNKKEFLKHSSVVAEAINKSIEVLDNAEELVPLLHRVGKAHVKRNVTPSHFINLEKIIVQVIQQALTIQASEKVLSAWKEVLSAVTTAVLNGAEA